MLIFSTENSLNLKLKDFFTQGPLHTRQRQVSKSTQQQLGNKKNKISPSHRAHLSNWNLLSVPKRPTSTWSSKMKEVIKSVHLFICFGWPLLLMVLHWWLTGVPHSIPPGQVQENLIWLSLNQSSSTKQVITKTNKLKEKWAHGSPCFLFKTLPHSKVSGAKISSFVQNYEIRLILACLGQTVIRARRQAGSYTQQRWSFCG